MKVTIQGIECHFDAATGHLYWCSDWGAVHTLRAEGYLSAVCGGGDTWGHVSLYATEKAKAHG